MLSKHHYAMTLARSNKVFFLNPPLIKNQQIKVESSGIPNLSIVDAPRGLPGINQVGKIFPSLADFYNGINIHRILSLTGVPDVIWSFDPFRFQNLSLFGATTTIFHAMDLFNTRLDLACAQSAQIILSVSDPILRKYASLSKPSFFINHGVSEEFLKISRSWKQDSVIRCGYVGNLLSKFIDHESLERIVRQNAAVEFHFIGPSQQNNLGSKADPQNTIHGILKLPNVVLHGELSPANVAGVIAKFDMFLICYNDQSQEAAANNHKILEYLSTGKQVVSTRISTYDHLAKGLFEMVESSRDLAKRFSDVVGDLPLHNTDELQERRIAFARDNSYEKQVERIEALINTLI